MGLLADTGLGGQGRWIVTPRKGMAFVGPKERARERALQRRRRVFVFMIESIGLTALIGIVPPLRVMWYASAALVALLGAYVWLLVSIRSRNERGRLGDAAAPANGRPVRQRHATDAGARMARPAFNGLASFGGDDLVNIVVKPVREPVGVARG